MTPAIKGALLSGIVFPGLGQIYLKHYRRGLIFAIPTLIYSCIFAYKFIVLISTVMEKIKNSVNNGMDMHMLQGDIELLIRTQNMLFIQIGVYLVTACWLISIVDAYLLGLKVKPIIGNTTTPPQSLNK